MLLGEIFCENNKTNKEKERNERCGAGALKFQCPRGGSTAEPVLCFLFFSFAKSLAGLFTIFFCSQKMGPHFLKNNFKEDRSAFFLLDVRRPCLQQQAESSTFSIIGDLHFVGA